MVDPRAAGTPKRGRGLLWGVVALAVVILIGSGVALVTLGRGLASPPVTTTTESLLQKILAAQDEQVAQAEARVGVKLPDVPGRPAPALPVSGFAHPLPSHQVFGFLPYWELGGDGTDLDDLTTVAYFGLGVTGSGQLVEQGNAWDDLGGNAFAQLESQAHAAGVRVLLTVTSADQTVIDAISEAPVAAAARLFDGVAHLLESYHLDGVDLDLEGQNSNDRAGFAQLVQILAGRLHALDPSWDVVVDTYPQSASDGDDFYDIASIAPHVNQFFIMDYDMEDPSTPSATSPLNGIGLSDVSSLQSYSAIVPPAKLILGVPFYGVDWAESSPAAGPLTLSGPTTIPYATIAAAGHVPIWDPASDTAWFTYLYKGQKHVAWFDNPLSLALKASLASGYHIGGVGIWALGMQGAYSGMVTALLGGSPPLRLPLATPVGG
jgi:Glycosyl hydrolases family 18